MKTFACSVLLGSSLAAAAPSPCPAPVTAAVEKNFPKSTVQACKAEHENGHDTYEVKLRKTDGSKVEVDVSPTGAILQTEEVVSLDQVPAGVMKAFTAKYQKAKASLAEKQTPASGKVTYELTFDLDGKRRSATFATDGKFVEEE